MAMLALNYGSVAACVNLTPCGMSPLKPCMQCTACLSPACSAARLNPGVQCSTQLWCSANTFSPYLITVLFPFMQICILAYLGCSWNEVCPAHAEVLVLNSKHGAAQRSCAEQERDVGQQACTHTVEEYDRVQLVM